MLKKVELISKEHTTYHDMASSVSKIFESCKFEINHKKRHEDSFHRICFEVSIDIIIVASWWQPATIRWLRWLLLSVGTFYFPLLFLVLSWNIDAFTSGKLLQFPSLNELIAHSILLLNAITEQARILFELR